MNRKKKLLLNTGSALFYQLTTMICGFIMPKVIIPYFGSAANGLIDSITQFLSIITLCDLGVGAVVQSTLYKPLAENDDEMTSKIIKSSNNFFNKVQKILLVYIAVLVCVYPLLVKNSFGFVYTATLVLIMAGNYMVQYYLFLSYRLLLSADQRNFIRTTMHSFVWIFNTAATVVLVHFHMPLHVIKGVSLAVLLLQPLTIKFYVDRHYNINKKIELTEEPIKQKWNGLAQHISAVVLTNTDTIVLTVFSTLENVSVYSVYNLVATGLKQVILTSTTGSQALLGNMYAKNEKETLMKTYSSFELIFHFMATTLYTVAAVLIIPFVRIYTKNFSDANYIVPAFGIILMAAWGVYSIRLPYIMMVNAAGHFKQTQTSAIIEAVLNLSVSCMLVWKFGLIGVAIGTLIAMTYRTCYLAIYLSKNIINREIKHFIKHVLVDLIVVAIGWFATKWITLGSLTYTSWAVMAVEAGLIIFVESIIVNYIFYRDIFKMSIKMLAKKR